MKQFSSIFDLDEVGYVIPDELLEQVPKKGCVVASYAVTINKAAKPLFDPKSGLFHLGGIRNGDFDLAKTAEKVDIIYEGENYNALFFVTDREGRFIYELDEDIFRLVDVREEDFE